MVRKTKKAAKSNSRSPKTMTVPKLRHAFEHIQRFLHKGSSVPAFRKEWKKVFGTELSEKVAADYLAFVEADKSRSKKQRGGAQLFSPAALGYDMTMPSIGVPSVPAYVAGGMGLPADSITATCGQVGKSPFLPPAASMGSNQVGGNRKRGTRKLVKGRQNGGALSLSNAFSEFMQRPLQMGSPPTIGNDIMMLSKGYNQFSSPRPEINPVGGLPPPAIYTAGILPISKTF